MKALYILLCFLALFALSGCEDRGAVETSVDKGHTEQPAPLIPELEYTEISGQIFSADIYGKAIKECDFNEENCFLKDERVYGYDYVSLFGVKGTLSVYLDEGRISSIVFGSEPFNKTADFNDSYADMNEQLSEKIGADIVSPVLMGADETDDDAEMLLNGNGYYLSEYRSDTIHAELKSCGVKGTATIVVECSLAK